MAYFTEPFGALVIRWRIGILLFWLALLVPGVYGASQIAGVLRGEMSTPNGSEMHTQEQLILNHFPEQSLYHIAIVIESKNHLIYEPVFQSFFTKIIHIIASHSDLSTPLTYKANAHMLDKSQKKTFILVDIKSKDYKQAEKTAVHLRNAIHNLGDPHGISVYLTGGPFIFHDSAEMSTHDALNTEKHILPLIFVGLILVFGGGVAAALAVLGGVMATLLTLALLYILGHWLAITTTAQNITSMIGLGIGIDYSLLIISRFREELAVVGRTKEQAAIKSIGSAGQTILYAGLVVSIGMVALLVPNSPLMRSLGISGLLVVGITLLVCLTFLPAALSLLGYWLDTPLFLHKWTSCLHIKHRFWYHWSKYIMSKPVFFSGVGIGLLLTLSLAALDMRLWSSNLKMMPKELEARVGLDKLVEIDPLFTFAPILLTFETKDRSPIWLKRNIEQIYGFVKALSHQEALITSLGLINFNQSLDSHLTLFNSIAGYGGVANMRLFQPEIRLPFIGYDETKATTLLFHQYRGYDLTDLGMVDLQTLDSIRDYRTLYTKRFSNLNILVGGLSGVPVELKNTIQHSFPMVIGVLIVLTYLFTLLSFGSVLLPLKAILLNLLSITATYGCLVFIFQDGYGAALFQIEPLPGALLLVTPLVLFCIIFSLSMDYEIFLLHRIREEYENTGNHEEAIALGLEKTGGIITSAALIMILVVLGFAFSRIMAIKEFGLGLGIAILIDATVIRIMIVPALMKLMGPACWYLPPILKHHLLGRGR